MQKTLLTLITCIAFLYSKGNNISISNTKITGQNVIAHHANIQFNLSWENSWRCDLPGAGQYAPYNYDAAWVFVKYRVSGGEWKHATISCNPSHHTIPGGSTIKPVPDSTGVFLYRDGNGTGNIDLSNIQLRWNYGSNGVADGSSIDVKVFAIEMVYVPTASFYLGSGGTESGSFTNGSRISGPSVPFQITSDSALGIDNVAGKLWGTSTSLTSSIGNAASNAEATLSASFPKGYSAFFCMKYEINQQQWVNFFNTLNNTQKTWRDITGGVLNTSGKESDTLVNRNNINWTTGDAFLNGGTFGTVACNFLSWADVASYLDWSGLRPMTELEYEKACRGDLSPVASEYAWGSSNINFDPYTVSNGGIYDEGLSNGYNVTYNTGNASFSNTDGVSDGPLRGGIFAANSSNNGRITSGASYYGIMEMCGNLYERTITLGNNYGRSFTGLHGNGNLSSSGNADVYAWPGTNAIGAGFRGGAWNESETLLRVSDRNYAAYSYGNRDSAFGGRGVRSAP